MLFVFSAFFAVKWNLLCPSSVAPLRRVDVSVSLRPKKFSFRFCLPLLLPVKVIYVYSRPFVSIRGLKWRRLVRDCNCFFLIRAVRGIRG